MKLKINLLYAAGIVLLIGSTSVGDGFNTILPNSWNIRVLADRSLQNIGKMVVPSLRRLPPEQREQLTNMLIHTLGQIQGEVSRCL